MVEGSAGLVVFPRSADDVAACMRIAASHDLPVVPRGSGTGLAGGGHPDRRRARRRHHQDEPDPRGPAGGPARVGRARRPQPRSRHGARADRLHVRARPLVATGQLDRRQRQHERRRAALPRLRRDERARAGARRRAARRLDERIGSEAPARRGYDLRGVVVGSEGTLGIVTAACVRLTPLAPAVRTMLLDFERVQDCAATVSAIIARGVVPAALEMMDRGIVRAVENFAHAGYPTDAAAVLLVEVDGLEAAVEAQAARGRGGRARARRAARSASPPTRTERALLWKGRKSAFGAIAQIAPALPPARLRRAAHASWSRCSPASTRSPSATT